MRMRMSMRNSECFKCFSAESQVEVRIYNKRPNQTRTQHIDDESIGYSHVHLQCLFLQCLFETYFGSSLGYGRGTTRPWHAVAAAASAATALASALSTVTVASSSVAAIRVACDRA